MSCRLTTQNLKDQSSLAEDACFWLGIALGKTGDSKESIAALEFFLSKWPLAKRSQEARVTLGWMLIDRGDLGGAEPLFISAQSDLNPKIKKSALNGLNAIKARRK